jgi:putative drug exporter of the RND superfamily
MRSLFDGLDGVDRLSDNLNALLANVTDQDQLMPQLVNQLPPMIAVSQDMQSTMKSMYSTFNGLINQIDRMTDTASAMGQAFDDAKSDDYFYQPPEAFDSPDFQRGLKLMLSPDGKSAQFIITHDVDPATPEGISHVDAMNTSTERNSRSSRSVGGRPIRSCDCHRGCARPGRSGQR